MKTEISYDHLLELERIIARLQLQGSGTFICITADNIPLHSVITKEISQQLTDGKVQIIDFQQMYGKAYSATLMESLIDSGAKYVILPHFHLAKGSMSDAEFFQVFNLSRDALADLPIMFVFIVPGYFRMQLARYAPDFNSFFQYNARLETERDSDSVPLLDTDNPHSETNKHLLDYYRERLGEIPNTQSKEYFEALANILALNDSVRTLLDAEQRGFFADFCRLLPVYENDIDIRPGDIANIFDSQGDYPKTLEWYFKSLDIKEKVLGNEHPSTAQTYNNIAVVYRRQVDYPKALEWYFKSLDIQEKILGNEHPSTAETYNNIAIVYSGQGDYPKALEWHFKSLDIKEKVLGNEHPSTAQTYNNIAIIYSSQGNYPKALEWYFKSLDIKEKALGNEHPSTAETYNNIAIVYTRQRDYPKALEWYFKSLDIKEKVLGNEHPSTATTYSNIALVYADQGDYQNALDLLLKCYRIRIRVFGEANPVTLKTKSNLKEAHLDASLPQPFETWLQANL